MPARGASGSIPAVVRASRGFAPERPGLAVPAGAACGIHAVFALLGAEFLRQRVWLTISLVTPMPRVLQRLTMPETFAACLTIGCSSLKGAVPVLLPPRSRAGC